MQKKPEPRELLTVVVTSCEKYSDLWPAFSALWRKFWPDCPFEKVLVTDRQPDCPGLVFDRVITYGHGLNWCQGFVKAMAEVHTPYILNLCDDYFLTGPVPTDLFLKRLRQAQKYDAVNLRLIPNPVPTKPFPPEPDMREYEKDTAYCVSFQAGIWLKDFLVSLAAGCDCIWEIERYGSFRCGREKRPILGVLKPEFPFVDAVHKGHWETFGAKVCADNGIAVDFSKRGFPSAARRAVEWAKGVILRMNPTLVVRLQNRFGIGKKEDKPK